MNDGRGSGLGWEGGLGRREVEGGHMAGARTQEGAPVVGEGGRCAPRCPPTVGGYATVAGAEGESVRQSIV